MAVPLTGAIVRKSIDGPGERAHRGAVERQKGIDAARTDVTRVTLPFGARAEGTSSSSGIGQFLAGAYPETGPEPGKATKANIESFHVRTKAHAGRLSPNAARLLDLMVMADEAHSRGQLVQAPVSEIARVFSIKSEEADGARQELERQDLIRFFDNGSLDRGYRVQP